jgi:polysaccharide export outer membrane protein
MTTQRLSILGKAWPTFLCLVSATLIGGCQSPSGVPARIEPGAANYATNILQEGDLVSISFQYSTNFNSSQRITLNGSLNLEAVGAVKAAGKTPQQLEAEIAKLYAAQGSKDWITVKVVAAEASIYISGAVYRPGKIPLERPMTVLEAIMEAGGYDPNRAKLAQVTVLRLEEGKQKTYRFDLKRVLKGENESPFYLQPFDIVHVPNKTFNF